VKEIASRTRFKISSFVMFVGMPEIWVPYGPVEVSFDIKQENLSQILEPTPSKVNEEEIERVVDAVAGETVVLLSGSSSAQRVLDKLLTRNKLVRTILHPKEHGALARRKSQEFGVQAELFNPESLSDIGSVDTTAARYPSQIAGSKGMILISSVHYDPLFGITSAGSDLASLVQELKGQCFKRSMDELPCQPDKSNASWYSSRLLESAAEVKCLEIIEKSNLGITSLSFGSPGAAHQQTLEYWKNNLKIDLPSKAERVIFGCGGLENDTTLTRAFARSFFNIVSSATLEEAKVCMLAECSHGLGSEALLRFVTGRYEPRTKLDPLDYFDGLEVLISFYRVQGDLELTILTTLPHFYASKFDFKTIRGAKDAPSSLVQQGSRAKILVVPDASSSFFTAAS
jgi:hypothetical protein